MQYTFVPAITRSLKKIKMSSVDRLSPTVPGDLGLFGDLSDDETLSDDYPYQEELIHKCVNDSLMNQINTLRKELKDVHSAYVGGIKLRDCEITQLQCELMGEQEENGDLYKHNIKLWEHVRELNEQNQKYKEENEEWIGRTLKFEYLFKQMKKIGLKQSDYIFECFEDIEIPEVSIRIKDKFIPTAQTDNIDYDGGATDVEFTDVEFTDVEFTEGDNDIIGEFIEQETTMIDHAVTNNATIMIQRIFRGYILRKHLDDHIFNPNMYV